MNFKESYIEHNTFKKYERNIISQQKASQFYHVAVLSQLHFLHDVLAAVVADHPLQIGLLDVVQQLVGFVRELHRQRLLSLLLDGCSWKRKY